MALIPLPQKLSWRLQLKQGSGSTPHRLLHPDKSGNERGCTACLGWREWVWPRAAKSGVDPPQFTTSRWAAEMSSRTDGPEQITNNTQRYKTAETHCWRWLILQTEIWGRTTEKKGGLRGRGGRETQRGENRSIRYKTQKYMFPSLHWKAPFQNEIHHVFLIHTSRRGGEGEKNWTEERQVLVGKWTDSAYFIRAISSILLD